MDGLQDEAKQMKCVICHGDTVEPKNVREELHIGDDIVYVTVEALVCTQCGERYFDRSTVRKLEAIERELERNRDNLSAVGQVLVYNERPQAA